MFKTDDRNSVPFPHTIESIMTYKGRNTQMMIIKYKNKWGEYSIVKLVLEADSD